MLQFCYIINCIIRGSSLYLSHNVRESAFAYENTVQITCAVIVQLNGSTFVDTATT